MEANGSGTKHDGKPQEGRLQWCMERVGWSGQKWSQIFFTDEKNLT